MQLQHAHAACLGPWPSVQGGTVFTSEMDTQKNKMPHARAQGASATFTRACDTRAAESHAATSTPWPRRRACLLYTSDAADDMQRVDL
eukprot:15453281-Alexandrium_andersonii.AAC.2